MLLYILWVYHEILLLITKVQSYSEDVKALTESLTALYA